MKDKLPSHPKHPLYVPGLVQPYQLPPGSVPWDSITGKPQLPVPGAHLMNDDAVSEPMAMPGPQGVAGTPGTIGVDGKAGPPGMDGEPADDWPLMIPGPQGPQGIQGIPGVGGGGGTSITQLISPFDDPSEDLSYLMGFAPQGQGTPNRVPKWGSSGALVDSVIQEVAGVTQILSGGLNIGQGVGGGSLTLFPTDNALEGGQIDFMGGGNGGAPYKTWSLDSWTGTMRLFETGLVRHVWDSTYYLAYNTKQGDVGHGVNWAGWSNSNKFNTTDYALLQNNGTGGDFTNLNVASGGTLSLRQGNVDRFIIDPTHWLDNRNVNGDGGFFLRTVTSNNADQAAFANVQTNVTGLIVPTQANCTYEVWVDVVTTMVGTGGVKFYFTGPPGMTGEMTVFASSGAALTNYAHLYQAVLTVPGTFLNAGIAGTHIYKIKATIRIGGTSSTVQLVGITSAAGVTCVVKKGSSIQSMRSGT